MTTAMSLDRSFRAADQARATIVRGCALILLLAGLGGCREDGRTQPDEPAASRIPPNLAPRFWPPDGWAWGKVAVGQGRAIRYGVAAPAGVAKAQIVVAAGYAEPIEAWFETVADLNGRGVTVWVVEGGAEGVTIIAAEARRASPSGPIALLSHDDGAPAAIQAARALPGLAAIILSSPDLSGRKTFGPAWTREVLDARQRGLTHDAWRGAAIKAWQTANPDLRTPLKSASIEKITAAALTPIQTPVLIISGKPIAGEVARLCATLSHCSERDLPGGAADLHMESDAIRADWLTAVVLSLGLGADHGL